MKENPELEKALKAYGEAEKDVGYVCGADYVSSQPEREIANKAYQKVLKVIDQIQKQNLVDAIKKELHKPHIFECDECGKESVFQVNTDCKNNLMISIDLCSCAAIDIEAQREKVKYLVEENDKLKLEVKDLKQWLAASQIVGKDSVNEELKDINYKYDNLMTRFQQANRDVDRWSRRAVEVEELSEERRKELCQLDAAVQAKTLMHEDAERELKEVKEYADKLVEELPFLPKDIEVLRKANYNFAKENERLKQRILEADAYNAELEATEFVLNKVIQEKGALEKELMGRRLEIIRLKCSSNF